jgi:hypothetical protein
MTINEFVKIDWNTQRDILESEAEKGNPEALLYIAIHSTVGTNGFAQDEVMKIESCKRGAAHADMESPAAQCCRGICCRRGYGIDKNEKEAVEWFRKTAEQGFAPAQWLLGDCYEFGTGVDEDKKIAVEWFRKAAEQGLAPAQFTLGSHYYYGSGVDKDKKVAAEWYHKAAEQGEPTSQFVLYMLYYRGDGVDKDRQEAHKWLKKAAEQGYEQAVYYSKGIVGKFFTWTSEKESSLRESNYPLLIVVCPLAMLILGAILLHPSGHAGLPLLIYALGPPLYIAGLWDRPRCLFLGATLILVPALMLTPHFLYVRVLKEPFSVSSLFGTFVVLGFMAVTIHACLLAISKSFHLNGGQIKYALAIFLLAFLPFILSMLL